MANQPFFDHDVLVNSGEFLRIDHAADYLQNFYDAEESSVLGNVKDTVISGQVVALRFLKQFVDKIGEYNLSKPDTEQIIAVRIYSALSNRRGSTTLPPDTRDGMPNKNIRDVILEPVKADGSDLHDLRNSSEEIDYLILGMTLPCPNVCPKAFNCKS